MKELLTAAEARKKMEIKIIEDQVWGDLIKGIETECANKNNTFILYFDKYRIPKQYVQRLFQLRIFPWTCGKYIKILKKKGYHFKYAVDDRENPIGIVILW